MATVTAPRLDGKRIVVVGAGTQPCDDDDAPVGNGRAISVLAAREGATVVCADSDAKAAEETAGWITREGGRADVVVSDVASEEGCATLVASAAGRGPIDGLVLNVGIAAGRRLEETTAEQWDYTFAVNLRSHFLLCKAALPVMEQGASIVFIASVAGLTPGSQIPSYDSSKAGIIGLCRHVAMEGARKGVRANVVAPGLIDTPLGRLATAGRPSRAKTPVPLGREGTAEEVAAPVVFLLSDEASYITSQVLAVDGGLSA
jgi:NAD(P)-dependent dehydrogenase (short-subunit alcohol dehydrogenase family)